MSSSLTGQGGWINECSWFLRIHRVAHYKEHRSAISAVLPFPCIRLYVRHVVIYISSRYRTYIHSSQLISENKYSDINLLTHTTIYMYIVLYIYIRRLYIFCIKRDWYVIYIFWDWSIKRQAMLMNLSSIFWMSPFGCPKFKTFISSAIPNYNIYVYILKSRPISHKQNYDK